MDDTDAMPDECAPLRFCGRLDECRRCRNADHAIDDMPPDWHGTPPEDTRF